LFLGFFRGGVRIAVVTEHPIYLIETRDVPSDVFSFAQSVVVAVVRFSDVAVVIEAFECGCGSPSGDVEGFLEVLRGVSPLGILVQVRHDV